MRGKPTERGRVFSIVGVLAVATGLLALLFYDVDAVQIDVEVMPRSTDADPIALLATVVVPTGQRLPVEGATLVVEDVSGGAPFLVDAATCWGETTCDGGIRHAGRAPAVDSLTLIERTAEPTFGELLVRVEGYGRSSSTGYGTEVEPQRRLSAKDVTDAEGRQGFGIGYGGDQEVTLRYRATIPAGALPSGTYHLTFLIETGSSDMGPISGPFARLQTP